MTLIGTIHIKDLKIHGYLGAHPEERERLQEVSLDLWLDIDISKCILSDALADTVDYDKVVKICRNLLEEKKYHLLETFAHEVLNSLFKNFKLLSAKIKIKKKGAIPLAEYAAFELEIKK